MRNGGKGVNGSIPARVRETVENLKEIVDFTDQEIYAVLEECNMEPNEAIHRLLNQDAFHEVKSKREKKKETKGAAESRYQRLSSSTTGHSIRCGTDRAGRYTSAEIRSNDYTVTCGEPVHKKENGPSTTSSILGSGMGASSSSWNITSRSNCDSMGNSTQVTGLVDNISLPQLSSSEVQHNWMGVSGHLSMADIVKMGRPQQKSSSTPMVATEMSHSCTSHNVHVSNTPHESANCFSTTFIPSESNSEFHSSQDHVFKVIESEDEPNIVVGQQKSLDEWHIVDQPSAGSVPAVLDTSFASAICSSPPASSNFHVDGNHLQLSHVDDIQKVEGNANGDIVPIESTASDGLIIRDNSGGDTCLHDESFKSTSSYQSPTHPYDQYEVDVVHEGLSSNLQQLSLQEQGAVSAEENSAVIIPDHLQVTNSDCSHLSFGSFGSGVKASLPGAFTSKPLKNDLEICSVAENPSLIDYSDARKPEYQNNEQLPTVPDDKFAPTLGTTFGNYDLPSASQPEVTRDDIYDTFDATHRPQYDSPSGSGFAFSSNLQPSAPIYTHEQPNLQMQNAAALSSLLQSYDNSISRRLLAGAVRPAREFDIPFLALHANQSMPTNYSTDVSSLSGSTISEAEVLKQEIFSTPQLYPMNTSSSTVPTGTTVPQRIMVSPYSHPSQGSLANLIGHPFHSQSFTYMPSSGSDAFQQGPTVLQNAGIRYTLPQLKSDIALNNLPQPLSDLMGYGDFRRADNLPGTFLHNPAAGSASSAVGYEGVLGSQQKKDHFIPLHQAENSMTWHNGSGSRTPSSIPASTYYGLQQHRQHVNGIHPPAQQAAHRGMLGYQNFYHSQAGASREQHQHLSQGILNGSQDQSSQQPHQLWHQSY